MKILALSALLFAMVALTAAAPAHDEEPEEASEDLVEFVKRDIQDAHEEEPKEASEDLVEVVKRDLQGWSLVGDRYFRYENREMTWPEAERNCRSLGGHLASLHSYYEYQFVQSLITPSGNPTAWLGGSDALQEGVWEWSDGTSFRYSNWCTGEPNNGGGRNQDCLQMSYTNYKCWDDLECEERLPSVCAKKK